MVRTQIDRFSNLFNGTSSFEKSKKKVLLLYILKNTFFQRISLDKLLQRMHKFQDRIVAGAAVSTNEGTTLKIPTNAISGFDC